MAELQARLLAYARAGDAGGVEATLRGGAGLDTPGMDSHPGRCAIHHASAAGHVDVVRLLISWGTDVNLISRFDGDAGGRPAHLAAEAGYTRTLMDLLEAGADPFYYDAQGYLPVHRAAARGRWRVLKVFKYYGYDLSVRTADWSTSLHLAAACGNLRLVTWLVHNGVRPDLTDGAGRTAHNHPQVRFHKEVQDYLASVCRMFQFDSWGNSYLRRGYYMGQYRAYQGRQYIRHNRSYSRPQKISRANQASSSNPAEEETDELELESSPVDPTSTFSSVASSAMSQTTGHTETSLPVDNALSQPKESTHMETSSESTPQKMEVSPQNEGVCQQPSIKLMNGLESPAQTAFSESVWTQRHTASQRKEPWQMEVVNVARGNTKERPIIDVTENIVIVKEEVQSERKSCEKSVREIWEKDYLHLCGRDDQNGCHSLGEDADSLSHPHPDVYQTETEAINEWQLEQDQNSQWETSEGTKSKEKEVVTIDKHMNDDPYQRGFIINEEMEAKLHPSEKNNNMRKMNEDVNSDMLNNNHLEEKELNGVMPTGDILEVEEKSYQKLKVNESKEQTEEKIWNSNDNKQKELGNDILKSKNKIGTTTKEEILSVVGVKTTYEIAAEEVEKVTISNEYRSKDNKENEVTSKNVVEKRENKRENLDKTRIGEAKSFQKIESINRQKNEEPQETNHDESGMHETSKPETRISQTYILNGNLESREELLKVRQQMEAPGKKKIDEFEVQNTIPIEVSHPNSADQIKQERKEDEEGIKEKDDNGKETTSTKKASSKMGKNKKDKLAGDNSSVKATSQSKLTEREKGENLETSAMVPKDHQAKQRNGAEETIPKEPKGNESEAERPTIEEIKGEDSKTEEHIIEGPVADVCKVILPDENECKIEGAVATNSKGDKSKVQELRIHMPTEVKTKESYLVSEVMSIEKQTDSKSEEPRTKSKTGDHKKPMTLEVLTEDRKVEGTQTEEWRAGKPVLKFLQGESEPDPVPEYKAKLKTKKSKRESRKQEIQSKIFDVKQSCMKHHNTGESQNKEPLIIESNLQESHEGEPQDVVSMTEPMTEKQKQKYMSIDHAGKSHRTVRFAPDLNTEQHRADVTIQEDSEPQELKADKPKMETMQYKIESSDKKHSKTRKKIEVEAPSESNAEVPRGECVEDSRDQVKNSSQLGETDISEQTPWRSEFKNQKSLIIKDSLKEKPMLPQKEISAEKKTDELHTQDVKPTGHESDANRMASQTMNLKQNIESIDEEREPGKEFDLPKKTKKAKKERRKNKRSSDEATSAPKLSDTAGKNESINNEKQTQPLQVGEEMKVERKLENMEPKEVERSESRVEKHRKEPEPEKTKIQEQNIRKPTREENKANELIQFEHKKKRGEKSQTEEPKDRNVGEETKKKELTMEDPFSVESNAECINIEERLSQASREEYPKLELTLEHFKAEPNVLDNQTENPQQEIGTDISKEEELQLIVPGDKDPLVKEPKEKKQVIEQKIKEPVKEREEKEHPDIEVKKKEHTIKDPKEREPQVKERKEKQPPVKELRKKEPSVNDLKQKEPPVKEPEVEVLLDKGQQAEESHEEISTKDKQVSETQTKLCKRGSFALEEPKTENCNANKVSEEKKQLQESAAEDLNIDIKVKEIKEETSCGVAETQKDKRITLEEPNSHKSQTADLGAEEFQADLHKQKYIKSEESCIENKVQPDVHETRDTNSENSKVENLKMMKTKINYIQAREKTTNFMEMDKIEPKQTKPKTLFEDDKVKVEKTITATPITEMTKVENMIIKQPLKEGPNIAKQKESTATGTGNLKKEVVHTKRVTEKRGGNSTTHNCKAKRKDKQRRQKQHLQMQRIELSFPKEIQYRREHTHTEPETKSEVKFKGVKTENQHNLLVPNESHTESTEKAEQTFEEPGAETKDTEESRGKEGKSLQSNLSSKHKSRLDKREEAKERKRRKKQKKAELTNTRTKPGRNSRTEETHMLTVATENPEPRDFNPEMPCENETVPLEREQISEMKTKKRINTETRHEIQEDVVRDENADGNLELNSGKNGIMEEEFLGIDILEKRKPQIEELKTEPCSKNEDEEIKGENGVSCSTEETPLSEMPSCVMHEQEHAEFAGEDDEINFQNSKKSKGKSITDDDDHVLSQREIESRFDPMHEYEVNQEICTGTDLIANGQSQMSPEEPTVESCKESIYSELVTLTFTDAELAAEGDKGREESEAGGITAEKSDTKVEAGVTLVSEELTLNTTLADDKEADEFEDGDIIEQEPAANSVVEEPAADGGKVEETGADDVEVEEPAVDTVKEEPAVDTVEEEPAADTVEVEPAADNLEVEEPAADSLEVEPAAYTVEVEEPAADNVEVEEPAAYTVEVEEPAADSLEVEEPAAVSLEVEEPAAYTVEVEEPAAYIAEVEEPAADSLEVEEPAAVSLEVEEPAAGNLEIEEPAADSVTEEPAAVSLEVEEPAADAVEVEEPAADSLEVEEPAAVSLEVEEPAADSLEVEEPAANSVTVEPAAVSLEVEEPAADSLEVEKPATYTVEVEEPAADSLEVEPAADSLEVEEPAADSLEVEEPATYTVEVEEPAAYTVEVEEPAAVNLEVEEPAADSLEVEEPAAYSLEAEEPAADSLEVEEPAADSVTEEPATDSLEVEEPAAYNLEAEESAADTVEVEEPAADNVEVEEPAAYTVEVEEPAADSLEVEEPAAYTVEVEEPAAYIVEVEEPAADSLEVEEPAAVSLEVEEPAAGNLEIEEPAADSVTEEPAAVSLEVEEPAAYAVEVEEPAADSLEVEEPAAVSLEVEEPAAYTVEVEEPAAYIAEVEEPAADSLEVEEPAAVSLEVEEPAAGNLEIEEPAADSVTEEPAAVSLEVEEPAAYAVEVEEPAADSLEVEEPAAVSLEVEEPAAYTVEVEEPAADSLKVEEPAAVSLEVEEPAAYTVEVEEPAADSLEVEEPAAVSLEVEEPAAYTVEVEEPAADSLEVEEPAAVSLEVEEPAAYTVEVEEPAAYTVEVEEPAADSLEVEEPAAYTVEVEEPAADSLEVEEPAADTVEVEEPAADSLEVEEPAAYTVEVEEPAADSLEVEEPAADTVEVEEPAADSLEVEEPAADSLEVEEPAAYSLEAEEPAADSVTEEPAAVSLEVEEPAADSLEVEEPAADSVEAEPAAVSLEVDEPAADSLEVEEPAADSLEVEEPAVDSVVTQEPAPDASESIPEPAVESVEVEKTAANCVVAQEPDAESMVTQEPAADASEPTQEPAVEDGVTGESAVDDCITEVPAVDGVAEVPAVEDGVTEVPAVENGVTKVPAVEDGVAEVPTVDGVTEVPTVEDGVAEVPTVKDGVTEVPTVEDGVAEVPAVDGVTEVPTVDGVTEVPAVEDGVAEVPAEEDGVAEVPAKEDGVAEVPTVGVTEVPAVDGVTEVPAVEDGVAEKTAVEDGITEESSAENIPADKEAKVAEGVVADSAVAVKEPLSENDKSSVDPKPSSSTSPDTTGLQKALASLKEQVMEIEHTFLETVQHVGCGGEEVEDEVRLHQPEVSEKVSPQGCPNTSYITSVVQCLFSLPTLRHYFISDDYRNDLDPTGSRGRGQVAEALAQVLKALAADGDTSSAVQHLGVMLKGQVCSKKPDGAPHHAFTLVCSLLARLNQELSYTKQQDASVRSGHVRDTSVISDWFQGMHETRYTCGEKKFSISRSRTLLSTVHVKIPFNSLYSLQELLIRQPRPEFVDWHCPACHVRHPCHHNDWLVRPPPILVIRIHRGSGGDQKQDTKSPPKFLTEDLSLCELLLPRVERDADYRLQGMITVTSDHHHAAYCYDPICHVWKHYKDGNVSETNLCTVLADMDVAILFYVAARQ